MFRRRKQSELSSVRAVGQAGPRTVNSCSTRTFGDDASWWRVRMRDRKTERIAAEEHAVANWFAPAPNNSLITARSVGTDEIYALDWKVP
jgi:hypothetical protein